MDFYSNKKRTKIIRYILVVALLFSVFINFYTSFASSCLYAARHFIPYSFSLWMYSTRRYRELSNTLAHLSAYYSNLLIF